MVTQTTAILAHLRRGESITPFGALRLFQCLRLGARIHELRERGFCIKRTMVRIRGKRVARYWL
jgi:hypothetical protein